MRIGGFSAEFPVLLAPMAGVTDMPFRLICKRMGADLTYTEMISAKALSYDNEKTHSLLETAAEEGKVAVQLFGKEPGIMAAMAAKLERGHGDGIAFIDINMGCPAHKIVANGEGCALMRDEGLASRIISAVANAVRLPVTVKFRKGFDSSHINALSFARMAEDCGAAAVAVHGRTREQGYSGSADWDCIAGVKAALKIPVFGNGDIFCADDALNMRARTGCDGVLIARGAQGNPFIFREFKAALEGRPVKPPDMDERIALVYEHAHMQFEYKGARGIKEMRKHLAWYVHGIPGANRLRARINECLTLQDIEEALRALTSVSGASIIG